MSQPTTTFVTTDELREGDVLHEHGMVMVLGPMGTYQDRGVTIYTSNAQVQNPEDVKDDRMLWGFLHTWYRGDDGDPVRTYTGVWRVQGNHHARWVREVR